ncbi:Sigma-70 region 2 [Prevotella disiens JCM 6334 = ATCC 29426]|uniref:Sigma-70 region 2 n=3 Tax=Prevotella disiens TaxID=28130 RepID=E1KU08_9BACT|nr:RNA polymerase sigma factor [Prevotella disiens]EFL45058.1 Sigma-70 region 2 [Prevotella disiens FB035-09AN]ERJ76034.1 Sigma-70 region 2 [Prevotella disiens JCM 6334 = ATCC 29426]SUB84370.1 RNA polymerase sigma factor [Prevotella disiens]
MESSQFKTLFLPCHRKLYAVAWRLTGNAQAAEDLVQETFLRLWTRRQQIVSVECVEAYSITTLRRIFYDTKRSKQIEASEREISELHVKDSEDLNQRIDAQDEWQRIRTMILALPDPQGKIMIMRDVEGQTYEEISVETGLTEVNLRSILSRARKRIREQIKEMRQ